MNWKAFKESLFASFLCTLGDLVSGLVLSSKLAPKFSVIPALIILIPPSADMRGNVYGALGSRLGSYLHMGKIEPKLKIDPIISENLTASLFLVLLISLVNGLVCSYLASLIGIERFTLNSALSLMVVSVLATVLSALFMIPSTLVISICSYRRGWDPDHITSPLVTLAGDMVTMPLIYLSVEAVLGMPLSLKVSIILAVFAFMILLLVKSERGFVARRIVREMLVILSVCAVIDYGAGTLLGDKLESFITIAGILTIIPPFLEDGGVLGCILAAKVSSWLHLGEIEPKAIPERDVKDLFLMNHVLGLVVFTMVGIIGQTVNVILHIKTVSLIEMLTITVFAGQILTLMLNFVSYELTVLSYRVGLDPDNVGIPIITSIMDLLGTGTLVAVLKLFGI